MAVVPERAALARTDVVNEPSPKRYVELTLLGIAWLVTGCFYTLASLGAKGVMPARLWLFLGAIVAITGGVHLAIRRLAPYSSQILLPVATLLNGIGYVEIARWNPVRAGYQAVWFVISAVGLVSVLVAVKRIRDLDRYRYLGLLGAVGLLVLPLVPGLGANINGARLWVIVGPLSFQPVEIAKILLVFFFASYFASNRLLLSTPSQRLLGRTIVPPRVLIPILAAWGFSVAVLGAENDVGFAMLLFSLFIALLWTATGLRTYLVLGMGLLVAGAYTAVTVFSHVQSRVSLWLDPWSATNFAISHQLAYGWFSLAAGGMTGTGLGLGQSGTVPEITSDMIFSAVGEELGLLGIVLLLCLFTVFVGETFRIAQRSHSDFVRLATAGLGTLVGLQAFFIMAGVLRLLPLTGVTLPFMAYGGSSLVSNYLIVGLLLRASDENAHTRRGGEILALTFD
jgi:peptidoglycan glycosyltransferase